MKMQDARFGIRDKVRISHLASRILPCAVCFGDPSSPMTHGAKLAVFFMLGVVGIVLGSIIGVALFWIHRSRVIDVQSILNGESDKHK